MSITYQNKIYPFNGYHWSELTNFFNLVNFSEEYLPGGAIEEQLRGYLCCSTNHNQKDHYDQDKVDPCRAFLRAMIGFPTMAQPLFKGLTKIKDDNTFMAYFLRLIPYMWT